MRQITQEDQRTKVHMHTLRLYTNMYYSDKKKNAEYGLIMCIVLT